MIHYRVSYHADSYHDHVDIEADAQVAMDRAGGIPVGSDQSHSNMERQVQQRPLCG